MASSGTTSLNLDFKFRPGRGREAVMVAGRAGIKSTAVIEAQDLELRTIKSFVASPIWDEREKKGLPMCLFGSVNTPGSMMNALTLRTIGGSLGSPRGTVNLGTVPFGTAQVSFLAVGG